MKDQAINETERPRLVPGSSVVRGDVHHGGDGRDNGKADRGDWWTSHRALTATVACVAAFGLLVMWIVIGVPCALIACLMNLKPKFE